MFFEAPQACHYHTRARDLSDLSLALLYCIAATSPLVLGLAVACGALPAALLTVSLLLYELHPIVGGCVLDRWKGPH